MRYPAILALGLLGGTAGCDLFDNARKVKSRSTVRGSRRDTPANAQPLANGAIADFECAVGSYGVMGGEITDELIDATQTADRYPYERRTMTSSDTRYAVNSCVGLGVYTPLQTARFSALNVLSLLQSWTDAQVPGRDTLIATLQAYEGYGLVLLGEGFCTMVVSTLDANRQTVYGGEIQRDSVFKLAIGYFGDAITGATATGQTAVVNMALVGRARAYADLGQLAPAAADAQLVASGFVKNVTASAINARRNNRIWQENSATSDNTTLDSVYTNMTDPRVPFSVKLDKNGKQRNSVTGYPLYQQNKYTPASTPLRLASWDEARLIIAEADWAATDYAHADSIINIFRARGGQSAITSIDRDSVKFALFDQRRRECFLEGQQLGDVIRVGFLPCPPGVTGLQGCGAACSDLYFGVHEPERVIDRST